jgi:LacI family transcriptional regulator
MSTMREVAERAGVSVTTVSHVINETRPVSAELRERVMTAAEELGYRPNILARGLRRGETLTIGLVIPNNANPFFAEIARGIEDATFQKGYSLVLCNTEDDVSKELRYINVLIDKQVDGIIFVSAGGSEDNIRYLQARDLPFVIVDRLVPDANADTVLTDNIGGGLQATRHLLQLNHTRIGCISGPSNLTPSADRVKGYVEALEEAELAFEEQLVVRGYFDFDSGYEGAKKLLTLEDPPSAIFACNDLMATGAIRAAEEAGIQVPGDLSIVGFDDIPLATYTNPPLTTVHQPIPELGAIASDLLLTRIQEPELSPRHRILETHLVIRGSTQVRRLHRG